MLKINNHIIMKPVLLRTFSLFLFSLLISISVDAQRPKDVVKIRVITRPVDGEVHTNNMDTLAGKIKIISAQDLYITSFSFSQKGKSKSKLSAYDVIKFMQVVPYPDREAYGVEKVYYKSIPHPKDKNKRVFIEVKSWEEN